MRTIEEIKKEKYGEILRLILDSGIPIQKEEGYWIATKAAEVLANALAEIYTALPRMNEDKVIIQTFNGRTADGYHPVDGKWRRITQIIGADDVKYYTDGEREDPSTPEPQRWRKGFGASGNTKTKKY